MCGICGIIHFNQKPVDEQQIRLMMQKMKHRGPDDEGVFLENGVGLGFVRLSILDLSLAGHQPMFSHNERYVVVFNGEVYNYIEIREMLKHKYTFRTGTDTEVILAAYQEWGEDCLEKFNGMFALAIYDRETEDVFLARDRYGIKPLYYYRDDEKLIFASEIKSILPLIKQRQANDSIIFDYLLYNRTDHTTQTFFRDIEKLQHGTMLKIRNGRCMFRMWYDVSQRIYREMYLSTEEYKELFNDAIKLRLRADVPVGVSLSGGLDSSAIVATLIKEFGLKDLNTFSAVYGEFEPTDESYYIGHLHSIVKNMHFIMPDATSFYEDYDNFIDAHNEPVPTSSPYVQYKVMELAKEHVTVLLDGQGADEQLGGYHYFFGSYYVELLRSMRILKLFSELFHYIKEHHSLNAIRYFGYYMLPANIQNRLSNIRYPSVNPVFYQEHKGKSPLNEMLFNPGSLNESLIQHFEYKLEHLLHWEDLNSMHFSIESRVPFLDFRLVEATLSAPPVRKISKGETKRILREVVKDIVPASIVNRKDKKGFSNPGDKWMRSDQFRVYIKDLINSQSFKERGYFNCEVANRQYERHLQKRGDYSREIWKWINLELWFQKFIDQ
jgi:asparagine synthase (glutamine-hydrolysing)